LDFERVRSGQHTLGAGGEGVAVKLDGHF
jgi:hypothetical protein